MAPKLRERRRNNTATGEASGSGAEAPPAARGNRSGRGQKAQYVTVRGEQIQVPHIYPDTFFPDEKILWTPAPEPYDPETYTAWGRKLYGEEWHRRRQLMLQERNIYRRPFDRVYQERQAVLRTLEAVVEGRMFDNDRYDEYWDRLWSRLSKDLTPEPEEPKSSGIVLDDDDDNLSGYSTYFAATESTPEDPPSDESEPWERLEHNRYRFQWSQETYQRSKFSLQQRLIEKLRNGYEDEAGDRQRQEEEDEIEDIRRAFEDPSTKPRAATRLRIRYMHRKYFWERLMRGDPKDVVEAERREKGEEMRRVHEAEDEKLDRGPTTQEEMNEKLVDWDKGGLSFVEQDRLARMYGFRSERIAGHSRWKLTRRPPPTQAKIDELVDCWERRLILNGREVDELLRMYGFDPNTRKKMATRNKVSGGRVSKKSKKAQKAPKSRNSPKSRQKPSGSRPAKAPTAAARAPRQTKRQDEVPHAPLRQSRRIAGQPPEHGLLPERGGAEPPRQPGPRKTAVKGSKPEGVKKAGAQRKGAGPPKAPAKKGQTKR